MSTLSSIFDDGIHVWGRLTAVSGTVALAFQLVAMFTSHWSVSRNIAMENGLQDVVDISFGLQEYCLTSPVPTFHGGFASCRPYRESVELFVAGANQSFVATGCELFSSGSPCDTITKYAQICGAVSIVLIALGSIFSEKVAFNGSMQALAAVLGLATIGLYTEFHSMVRTNADMTVSFSFGLFISGTAFCVVGAIGAILDHRLIERHRGIWEDGIFVFGRLGSFLAIVAWAFVALAVSSNSWTKISELGSIGDFCDDSHVLTTHIASECSNNPARLGLLSLCVSTSVPLFGNTSNEVCMTYTEEIQITNTSLRTPYDRFGAYDLEYLSQIPFIAVIVAVVFGVCADVFNEKTLAASVLLMITAVADAVAIGAWLSVQQQLARDDTGAESSAGIYYLACSLSVSFVGAIFMYSDFRKAVAETGDYQCCGCQCA